MSLIDISEHLRPYQSIYNFRDFGGYSGLDGRPVRTGLLFRSAHLNNLCEEEVTNIDSLPVGTVVDLRHATETGEPALEMATVFRLRGRSDSTG